MHAGNLKAQGPLHELRAGIAPRVSVITTEPGAAAVVLRTRGLADVVTSPGGVTALLGEVQAEELVAALVRDDVPVRGFSVQEATLEDLFLNLTGEGFDVTG